MYKRILSYEGVFGRVPGGLDGLRGKDEDARGEEGALPKDCLDLEFLALDLYWLQLVLADGHHYKIKSKGVIDDAVRRSTSWCWSKSITLARQLTSLL